MPRQSIRIAVTERKCPFCSNTSLRQQKRGKAFQGVAYYCRPCKKILVADQELPKPKCDRPTCTRCEGQRIMKDGTDGMGQRWLCKDCNYRFIHGLSSAAKAAAKPFEVCPHCNQVSGSAGFAKGKQMFFCRGCNTSFVDPSQRVKALQQRHKLKVEKQRNAPDYQRCMRCYLLCDRVPQTVLCPPCFDKSSVRNQILSKVRSEGMPRLEGAA